MSDPLILSFLLSIYSRLKCRCCHSAVGTVIYSSPPRLASARSLFLLNRANISWWAANTKRIDFLGSAAVGRGRHKHRAVVRIAFFSPLRPVGASYLRGLMQRPSVSPLQWKITHTYTCVCAYLYTHTHICVIYIYTHIHSVYIYLKGNSCLSGSKLEERA